MNLSCVLLGGIGNQLFQVSAVLSFSTKNKTNSVFAQWSDHSLVGDDLLSSGIPQRSKEAFLKMLKKWGGHDCEYDNLGEIFPNLNWKVRPDELGNSIAITPWYNSPMDSGFKEISSSDKAETLILRGFFMNPDYWHPSREFLLHSFSPDKNIVTEINSKYDVDNGISIHLRFASSNGDWYSVRKIPVKWYKNVLEEHFPDKNCNLIIITDDLDKANEHYSELFDLGYGTQMVYDDPVISLLTMSMCKKGHILHDSTFSFWGAYLDSDQPSTKTVLHKEICFSKWIVPYHDWIYVGDQ